MPGGHSDMLVPMREQKDARKRVFSAVQCAMSILHLGSKNIDFHEKGCFFFFFFFLSGKLKGSNFK